MAMALQADKTEESQNEPDKMQQIQKTCFEAENNNGQQHKDQIDGPLKLRCATRATETFKFKVRLTKFFKETIKHYGVTPSIHEKART